MYSVNQVLGLLTHRPIGWVNFPRKSRVSFNYKSTNDTSIIIVVAVVISSVVVKIVVHHNCKFRSIGVRFSLEPV